MKAPVIVETGQDPKRAVIWLHGLGANGHDFEPIVPELRLPAQSPVRFVFPHAPIIPVTINGGMVMPAWYDILEMSLNRKVDVARLRESAEMVHGLIEEQVTLGIASSHIVIAGFSQGGAVAYEAALSYDKPLGGLMAMSSYFATAKTLVPSDANRSIPIAIFHGTRDPVVPEPAGNMAVDVLKAMGRSPTYRTYPMEHQVSMEEVQDIAATLTEWLDL